MFSTLGVRIFNDKNGSGKPLKKQASTSRSMAKAFTRRYLLASLVPLLLLLALILTGVALTRSHLSDLLTRSNAELTADAKTNLQHLGEQIILQKVRDVAKQVELYFRMHPDQPFEQMRRDPLFMKIAIQKVGETGYTAITEAHTWLFRVHPNPKLNDTDMRPLAKKLPSWWKIVERAIDGDETTGYYDWVEPDGSVRQKFIAVTPVGVKQNGITIMVSATTYIDEFSTPVVKMEQKAQSVVANYQTYVGHQFFLFGLITALIFLLTFGGTYLWGRRSAMNYIRPIMTLADTAREIEKGNWQVRMDPQVTSRGDEIGAVGHSFDSMSRQLEATFRNLEQRVEELHNAQAALQESEDHFKTLYEESRRAQELYRSLIASSADAIVIYDLLGNVTYVSPMFSEIFGWKQDELIGKPIPYILEDERARSERELQKLIDGGMRLRDFETRRKTKDGRVIDVTISASRFNDHEDRPAGILVFLRDITETKKMKAHMQQVERLEAVGTLAGGIAHDFNNLLMVIEGTVSLLLYETPAADPKYRHFIDIEKQVRRGSKLTRQLLGYARKGKYDVKPLDLNESIRESAEAIRRTRKDVRLQLDLAGGLHPVEADSYQMEQVFMNLLINASDAMPEGGDLAIATQNVYADAIPEKLREDRRGDFVLVTVSDTGVGMDPKTMDRIFEPFFSTKPVHKGTGLGLASVYGIVKSHGGAIDVASAPGEGTVFSIYLPASRKPLSAEPPRARKAAHGRGTILLIDDEKPVLAVAADMLKAIGYETLTASDGRQGLELFALEKDRIDLVVLDMIMPDMNGGEVFDRLRAVKPGVPVLLSSGYSLDGKAMDILERGCNGFIQKPFGMEELSEKIQSILSAG